MTISERILQILQDEFPYNEEQSQEYYDKVYDIHSKIAALLPLKTAITPETIIRQNKPLWLWHKGRKEPVLANYRTDYPSPLFWEIVDGDYINNSNSIDRDRATHFMYINSPED